MQYFQSKGLNFNVYHNYDGDVYDYLAPHAGLLPSNMDHENLTTSLQYLKNFLETVSPFDPSSLFTVPFTVANNEPITTNIQRIATTNFLRPRNWGFLLDTTVTNEFTVPDILTGVTFTLATDQPNASEENEFLVPDPVDVWTSLQDDDPFKCAIVAPGRLAYYRYTLSLNQSTGAITYTPTIMTGSPTWFTLTPSSDVLYCSTTPTYNDAPYGVDLTKNKMFHYFLTDMNTPKPITMYTIYDGTDPAHPPNNQFSLYYSTWMTQSGYPSYDHVFTIPKGTYTLDGLINALNNCTTTNPSTGVPPFCTIQFSKFSTNVIQVSVNYDGTPASGNTVQLNLSVNSSTLNEMFSYYGGLITLGTTGTNAFPMTYLLGPMQPNAESGSNVFELNIFMNVSMLTDNPNFDWTPGGSQTVGADPFDSGTVTLPQLLGYGAYSTPSFDPMQHFIFTDPMGASYSELQQWSLAALHYNASTNSSGSFILPVTEPQYRPDGNDKFRLMYANKVMVFQPTSGYQTSWELSSTNAAQSAYFGPTTFTGTRTAFLWFKVNVDLTSVNAAFTNTFPASLFANKGSVVNYTQSTMAIETGDVTRSNTYGPTSLTFYEQQPLQITKYFRDRFKQSEKYGSYFPVTMPVYNPHQLYTQSGNGVDALTQNTTGYVSMDLIPQGTVMIMDPEYMYTAENDQPFQTNRASTLTNGANVASNNAGIWAKNFLYHGVPFATKQYNNALGYSTLLPSDAKPNSSEYLLFALAPRMFYNSGNGDTFYANGTNAVNISVSASQKINGLLVEPSSGNGQISIFVPTTNGQLAVADQFGTSRTDVAGISASIITSTYTPKFENQDLVCCAYVIVAPNPADTNPDDPYDDGNMYVALLNPSYTVTGAPNRWAIHVVQNRLQTLINETNGNPSYYSTNNIPDPRNAPVYPTSFSQSYSTSPVAYGPSANPDTPPGTNPFMSKARFMYSNANTAQNPQGSQLTSNTLAMTSYYAEYQFATDPGLTIPLPPRVIEILKPQTTYKWNPNAVVAFECWDQNLGTRWTTSNVRNSAPGNQLLRSTIDFSSLSDDDARANAVVQEVGKWLNDSAQMFASPGAPGTYSWDPSYVTANNDGGTPYDDSRPCPIQFTVKKVNNLWYLTVSHWTTGIFGTNSPRPMDISIDVRCTDPITRQVLGLGRVNKILQEVTQYGNGYWSYTFPDPLFFGPFSDTAIIMTPVSTTNASLPENNLTPDANWIKAQYTRTSTPATPPRNSNATGFQIGFYKNLYEVPQSQIESTVNYTTLENNAYDPTDLNVCLIRDVDNVFSATTSRNNSGIVPASGKYNKLLQSTANVPNSTLLAYIGEYPDPNGPSFLSFRTPTNLTPDSSEDILKVIPNFNGLDVLTTNIGSDAPYTFENFYWVQWPWVTYSTFFPNQNYYEGRSPVEAPNFAGGAAWFYPDSAAVTHPSDDYDSQVLSACTSTYLQSIQCALFGSSNSVLRLGYYTGADVGGVVRISQPDTFLHKGVPIHIGKITNIETLGDHWFVLSASNGPYTTYNMGNNLADLQDMNLSQIHFGPLFDTAKCGILVPGTSPFATWSTPIVIEGATTSKVIFMRKITVGTREILFFGDIQSYLVAVWFQNDRLVYSSIEISDSETEYGDRCVTDVALFDNQLEVSLTNLNYRITGVGSPNPNVIQYFPDARYLWSTSRNITTTPTLSLSNFIVFTTKISLADLDYDFTDAETLLNELGDQMNTDFGNLPSQLGTLYTQMATANCPLAPTSWAGLLTISAFHCDVNGSPALSRTYAARFNVLVNLPADSRLPYVENPPGTYTLGMGFHFDFVSKYFFNMLYENPDGTRMCAPTVSPDTFYVVGDNRARVGSGSDQNEPNWFRELFVSFKPKAIRDNFMMNTNLFRNADLTDNIFSDMAITYSEEVNANVYISDMDYAKDLDILVWTPCSKYAAQNVKIMYNTTTYATTTATTAPKFLNNAIVKYNALTNTFYVAGHGVVAGVRKVYVAKCTMGSTTGGTIAPTDNWTIVTGPEFTNVTCMDYSVTSEAIGGYTTTDDGPVTTIWYHLGQSAWQKVPFNQPGHVTAMRFVGFGWYIATWDPKAKEALMWFASTNFTVVAFVDAWTVSSNRINSIDVLSGNITGTCPAGFENSLEEPNVCYKICPTGYEGVGSICVQKCPPNFSTGSYLNQCIPSKYTPRAAPPVVRTFRNQIITPEITQFNATDNQDTNTQGAVNTAIATAGGTAVITLVLAKALGFLP
jgi:hypothetical protein